MMEENVNEAQAGHNESVESTHENASDQPAAQASGDAQGSDTPSQSADSGSQSQAVVAPMQRDTDQAKNFRAIREAAERATRERDEALQRLAQYERQSSSFAKATADMQPSTTQDQDMDLEFNLKDDELAEGKHLQKLKTTIRKLEAKQKELEEQSYTNSAETRLRSKFSDFDKVMTLENIRTFSAAYPELASSINASSDLYDKAVSAYTLIKRFGIHDDQPFEADKNKAIANTAKPRPLTSVGAQQGGDSPLSRANAFAGGLTEELKKQLREEMAAASKRY
jgi:hypothetical protein